MIFYADDDLDDLDLFTEIVKELGRNVLTFEYGDDLMYQLENPPPVAGILFLDINMPKRSGFEILSEIRSEKKWQDLPIVMFTTSSSPENIQKSRDLGANYYIAKTYDLNKLKKSIQHALSIDWKAFNPSGTEFFCA
jgi:CheY-like chemotaxis protein